MCSKWDDEWDRLDKMGIYTMEECSEKANEVADRDDDSSSSDTDSNDTSDDNSEN